MARDLPLSTDIPSDAITEDPNAPPLIAGQLLIYDLDETPPAPAEQSSDGVAYTASGECAISRQGLLAGAMAVCTFAFVMLIVIIVLYLKVRKNEKEGISIPSFFTSFIN